MDSVEDAQSSSRSQRTHGGQGKNRLEEKAASNDGQLREQLVEAASTIPKTAKKTKKVSASTCTSDGDDDEKKPAAASGKKAPACSSKQGHKKHPRRFADDNPSGDRKRAATGSIGASANKAGGRVRVSDQQMSFPERLMQLINDGTAPEHVGWIEKEEAISFRTNGFQEHVLDVFFQGLKYESFIRKLNRWGFRRVTSEGVPDGLVAYYHNSFRKDEQELISTMGIGKKNDPEVTDLQAFGGEHSSMIASASAAIASAIRETREGSSHPHQSAHAATLLLQPTNPYAVASPISPGSLDQTLVFYNSLAAGAASPQVQESKTDTSAEILARARQQRPNFMTARPQLDPQQVLLEFMLARQHQTDTAALQEREVARLAESILLQQSQQQRANAALMVASSAGRNDDFAQKLAALTGHSIASASRLDPFRAIPPQRHLPPGIIPTAQLLSSNPALALLLQEYQHSSSHPSPFPTLTAAHATNNPSLNNNNALSNIPSNTGTHLHSHTQPNPDLDDLIRMLLHNQQTRRDSQGPGHEGPN